MNASVGIQSFTLFLLVDTFVLGLTEGLTAKLGALYYRWKPDHGGVVVIDSSRL